MSFILDALRKSQQARQPGEPARTGAVHNITLSLPISGWWLALGAVLLLGLLVAVVMFWRSTVGKLPDPPAEPVTEVSPPAVAPTMAPVLPAVVEKPAASAEVPANKPIPVADLSEQAKVPAPPPPKKVAAVRSGKKTTSVSPAGKSTPVFAPAMPLETDDTPLLQQMPQDFQRSLPSLAVTIHVYSREESQRILFINNREYRKGSQIAGGIRVEDIVSDGAVLSFRGERFKLSRPR